MTGSATIDVRTSAPSFSLQNHHAHSLSLQHLMGETGLLLGFCGDVWQLKSTRLVVWMQKHQAELAMQQIHTAFIVPNEPFDLQGFMLSVPWQLTLPVLADPDGRIHDLYDASVPTIYAIDPDYQIQHTWRMGKEKRPSLQHIIQTLR